MLRGSGLLALVTAAVLLGILLKKTRTLELVGTIPDPEDGVQRIGDRIPPGRRLMEIELSGPGAPADDEMDHLVAAGLTPGLGSMQVGKGPHVWTWDLEVPEEVAESTRPGDAVVLTARVVSLPGFERLPPAHVRYGFRRGQQTWAFGESANRRFWAAYGLAGGGPVVAWAVVAGATLLAGRRRKSEISE